MSSRYFSWIKCGKRGYMVEKSHWRQMELPLFLILCVIFILGGIVSSYCVDILRPQKLMVDIVSARKVQSMPVRNIQGDLVVQAFAKKYPVYLSVTSIPDRVDNLPDVLSGIDTSYVKEILVSLPHKFGRTGQEYVIPSSLRAIDKVRIIRTKSDYGPITKFLPALQYIQKQDPEALLIVLDDDHFYPRGMVVEHMYAHAYANKPIITTGKLGVFSDKEHIPHFYRVHRDLLENYWSGKPELLHGVYSIGLQVSGVDRYWIQELLQYEKSLGQDHCFFADDLVVSFALRKKMLPFYEISTQYFQHEMILPMGANFFQDALHLMPLDSKNRDAKKSFTDLTAGDRLSACFKSIAQFEES